jgi:hypothetical protein
MKNYGNMRRVWKDEKPSGTYDREKKVVSFDFQEDVKTDTDGKEVKGYSGFEVMIDGVIDYGHIKSQLIEAAYPPKDEFGFLMNAMKEMEEFARGKKIGDCDFSEFDDVQEWRGICAEAAKEVMGGY